MNKSVKYILTILICFLSFNATCLAKKEENVCTYNGTGAHYETDYAGRVIGSKQYNYEITCTFYDDNSHSCKVTTDDEKNNSESINYWLTGKDPSAGMSLKKWYSIEKRCIPYIVFRNDNYFDLYGFVNETDAIKDVAAQKTYYADTSYAKSNSIKDDVTDTINSYIEAYKTVGKYFDLEDNCGFEDNQYTLPNPNGFSGWTYDVCYAKINAFFATIEEWNANVEKWISEGKIDKDSDLVKEYYMAKEAARKMVRDPLAWKEEPRGDDDYEPNPDSGSDSGEEEQPSQAKYCVSCGGRNNDEVKNIPEQLPMFIRKLVSNAQALIPILLILFGIYDYVRAIISNEEKDRKESTNRFIKRVIAGLLIFMTFAIVKWIFDEIEQNTKLKVLGCVGCFINSQSNCSEHYLCDESSFDSKIDIDGGYSNKSTTPIDSGKENSGSGDVQGHSKGTTSGAANGEIYDTCQTNCVKKYPNNSADRDKCMQDCDTTGKNNAPKDNQGISSYKTNCSSYTDSKSCTSNGCGWCYYGSSLGCTSKSNCS